MILDKQQPQGDVWGLDQTPAEHLNHSYNRKWAMWRMCQYLQEHVCMEVMGFYFNGVFYETEQMVSGCANQGVMCTPGPLKD